MKKLITALLALILGSVMIPGVASAAHPPTVEINSPGTDPLQVLRNDVTFEGEADPKHNNEISVVKLQVANQFNDDTWDNDLGEFTAAWTWFDATGTEDWSHTMTIPIDSEYRLSAWAIDDQGNLSVREDRFFGLHIGSDPNNVPSGGADIPIITGIRAQIWTTTPPTKLFVSEEIILSDQIDHNTAHTNPYTVTALRNTEEIRFELIIDPNGPQPSQSFEHQPGGLWNRGTQVFPMTFFSQYTGFVNADDGFTVPGSENGEYAGFGWQGVACGQDGCAISDIVYADFVPAP